MTPVARRHHAIEHIDAARHRFQHIRRRADTHQIPRAILRQDRRDLFDHRKHHRLRFAHREPADRIAVKTDVDQGLGAGLTEFGYVTALRDAEQQVSGRCGLEGPLAALRPAQRKLHGALDIAALRRQPHAFIELHGDVGAKQPLHLDRALRRQLGAGAVDMRAKGHRLFADFS